MHPTKIRRDGGWNACAARLRVTVMRNGRGVGNWIGQRFRLFVSTHAGPPARGEPRQRQRADERKDATQQKNRPAKSHARDFTPVPRASCRRFAYCFVGGALPGRLTSQTREPPRETA